ncbi:MAG: tyrosine-type recombinase/integrase, partial [Actinomycetota bacterium]
MKENPALEAMHIWLMELGNEGRSPRTVAAYEAELTDTIGFVAGQNKVPASDLGLAAISRDLLVAAIADFRTRPDPRFTRRPQHAPTERSPARVARRVAAVKVFFKWCYATGRIDSDPAALLRAPRKTKRLPKALEAETARAVIRGGLDSRWPERDMLIVTLALTTGLRLEEMATLKLDDLSGNPPDKLTVIGKGNKERRLPIPPVTGAAIAEYLPARAGMLKKMGLEARTLFISTRPRRIGLDSKGEPIYSVEATKATIA